MKHLNSDAELMRHLLDTVATQPGSRLHESVQITEDQLLLETEHQVHTILIPALHAVFEAYKANVFEADATDYTDEEILALAKAYPSIQDLISAHKDIGSSSKDGALAAVKQAAENIMKKTQSPDPIVKDPVAWVANKEDRLLQSLAKADPKGKYNKLSNIIQDLPNVVKKHPKTANAIVGLMGVAIPILGSGYWWAAPAAAILTKTVMDKLTGASWKSAIGKNLTYSAIGMAIGQGIKNFDSISTTIDSWLSGQSSPVLRGDVDSGSEMPRNPDLSMTMDPELRGDVESGSEIPRNPDLSMRDQDSMGSSATDWGTENSPLSGDIETTSVADRSYLGQVRRLHGGEIPSIGGESFNKAFGQAREELGSGNIFTWKGNLYTTNLAREGLYAGLEPKLVNFLKGIK